MAHLINDGYTLDATLARRGPWPALPVKYRACLPAAGYCYQMTPRETPKARLKAVVDLLAAQLVGWDILDTSGAAVPISAAWTLPATSRAVPM